jgi:alkylation response protein AidB-like acyl-CoA dehydrogenase
MRERDNAFQSLREASESTLDIIRSHAAEGEVNSRLAPETVAALRDSGMLSLWRPKTIGGHECDPEAYALLAEMIASADASAAWIMHGVAASWLVLRSASEDLVDEIIASADVPIIADTYNKPMNGERVEGGFLLNGHTPFASGSKIAEWIAHTTTIGEKMYLTVHPAGTLEIREDWDTLGIRGSSSNTVVAKDVFVPQHRAIDISGEIINTSRFLSPLYRMPTAVVPVGIASVSLGTTRAALECLNDIVEHRVPFGASSTLKHKHLAQLHYGRALSMYRASRSYMHECLRYSYDMAEKNLKFSNESKADLVLASTFVLQSCTEAVREVARASGTAAIHKGSPIERALRDAEVTSHHAFGSESRFASVAQAYWGLDIDYPLIEIE